METNKRTLVGLFGVILFWGMLFIAGLSYPGYSHIEMPISMLGNTESPNGWIINYLGLMPLGISIILTGYFFFKRMTGTVNKIGGVLIMFAGVGALLVGLFNCHSVYCDPGENIDNLLHVLGTMMTFLLLPLASVLIGITGLINKVFKSTFLAILLCGVGSVISFLLLNGVLGDHLLKFGFNQRILVFFVTAIVGIISVHLNKISSSEGQ